MPLLATQQVVIGFAEPRPEVHPVVHLLVDLAIYPLLDVGLVHQGVALLQLLGGVK